jgi:uncharacterized membrane protein YkgB
MMIVIVMIMIIIIATLNTDTDSIKEIVHHHVLGYIHPYPTWISR